MTDTTTDIEHVSLEERIFALEQKVINLEKERPGRRKKPIAVSQAHVCGVNPGIDSAECPDSSIYRYQQGCRGDTCVQINRDYYSEYRAKKAKDKPVTAEAVLDDEAG
jgi:hypothetical protein